LIEISKNNGDKRKSIKTLQKFMKNAIGLVVSEKILKQFFTVAWRSRIIKGVIVFLIFTGNAFGATKYAGDFLELGIDSRSLAMGSAYVTLADNSSGSYFNPACLSIAAKKQITLMHSEMFGGLEKYDVISGVFPANGDVGYGITILRTGIDDIKFTKLRDPEKGLTYTNLEVSETHSSSDYAFYISAGKFMRSNIYLGMSMKIIKRMVAQYDAFGFGLDMGALYIPVSWLRLGASFQDITRTSLNWNKGGNDNIDPSFRFGASVTRGVPLTSGQFTLALGADLGKDMDRIENFNSLNLGFEYVHKGSVAGRVGSHRGNMTAGVGLLNIRFFKISSLDYAFLAHDDLDSTHRISLSFSW